MNSVRYTHCPLVERCTVASVPEPRSSALVPSELQDPISAIDSQLIDSKYLPVLLPFGREALRCCRISVTIWEEERVNAWPGGWWMRVSAAVSVFVEGILLSADSRVLQAGRRTTGASRLSQALRDRPRLFIHPHRPRRSSFNGLFRATTDSHTAHTACSS